MRQFFLLRTFTFLMVICFPIQIMGQSVGLVLSGGGSKGVAHIGVIKALEEQGIPIDYVTGTSMGAIIGGMYAAGYSPDEMLEIINSDEFNSWIENDIDRNMRYFYKIPPKDASIFSFYYRILSKVNEKNIAIPLSVKRPFLMDIALMEQFMTVSKLAKYNFDSLFVPFRCVSSDVSDNQEVVFSRGDLGQAIRTSMSFPFYFKPIKVSGALLFDGGMYNNFPMNVMKKDFNPDVIIGSKVAANKKQPKSDDLVSQLECMLMRYPDYKIDSLKGVLIDCNIPSTALTDFSKTAAFIDSGYNKTKSHMSHIKRLVKRRVSQEVVNKRRADLAKKRNEEVIIGNIMPKGVKNHQCAFVIDSFKPLKGKKLSLSDFKEAYFKLATDERIDYMYPVPQYNTKTKKYDIILDIQKQEDLSISVGGNISSKALNEMFLKIKYSQLGFFSYSAYLQGHVGRFYSSGLLGLRLDNANITPFYVRGELSYNRWDYFDSSTYFFDDKQPSYIIYDNKFFKIDGGIPTGISDVFSIGSIVGNSRSDYYQENNFSRFDTADVTHYRYFNNWIKYERNNLNRKMFPSQGDQFIVKAQYVFAKEQYMAGSTAPTYFEKEEKQRYYTLMAKYIHYFPKTFYTTWGIHAEAVLSNQKKLTNYTSSILYAPKFEPFPAAQVKFLSDYADYSYAALGAINVTPIAKNIEVRSELYVYSPIRDVNKETFALDKPNYTPFSKRQLMGSAGVIYHSPIFPISFFVNYFPESNEPWGVLFNIGYLIFNPKPLSW